MNKKKLIKKAQRGTVFIDNNDPTRGTWGNRGPGNELESALENGLTGVWNGIKWVGDKVINAGDYIEDGLTRLIGFIPGGVFTTEEMLENNKRSREAGEGGYYYDVHGNLRNNPVELKAPMLPTLPSNATPAMKALFNDMKRARFNWQVRESQLRKLGKADMIESTGTAKTYRNLEKSWNDLINTNKSSVKNTDGIKLSKKQNA